VAREIDVVVDGLPAFIRSMRLSPQKLRIAEKIFLAGAARTVRKWAQENADQLGGVAAKAAHDIKIAGPGVVVLGGRPYDMGAEFGSFQYHQFERWRGKGDEAGYFLWPAIRRFRDSGMAQLWLSSVEPAFRDAFPETTE
jgi:hypothetical protein